MTGYKPDRSLDFYRQLRDNLDAIPGVESSALAVIPVLCGDEWDNSVAVEGFAAIPRPKRPIRTCSSFRRITFKTMHIPILAGRDFRMTDVRGAPKVCIVNEKFARKFFKDGNRAGPPHRHGRRSGNQTGYRDRRRRRGTPSMRACATKFRIEVYQPYRQMDFVLGMIGYVRTPRQPEQAFSSIRRVVNSLDPEYSGFR